MTAGGNALREVQKKFPNLSDKTEITSPDTSRYNCVAYAAGDTSRWWWPDTMKFAYWPQGCIRMETLSAFQAAFETLGYELCANGEYQTNIEKIAIFHKNKIPTHAARQIGNGIWTSKLGEWFDISHEIKGVSGSSYGDIAFFMERKKS